MLHYPTKTWRRDADGLSRLIGSNLECALPAVLGACGPSSEKPGKYWWGIGTTRGYAETIEEARLLAENHLAELESLTESKPHDPQP